MSWIIFGYFLGALISYFVLRQLVLSLNPDLKTSKAPLTRFAFSLGFFDHIVTRIQEDVFKNSGVWMTKADVMKPFFGYVVFILEICCPLIGWWFLLPYVLLKSEPSKED